MNVRIAREDPSYEQRRRQIVWNELVPDRYPALIAQPQARSEVAEIVRLAAAAKQRVAVKSGGHNWLGSALRDDAVLIDLSALDGVEVDVAAGTGTVEPGATHKKLADEIVGHGLAFPIGHCPTVGLGGYLMAGGAGWNMHEWGPGCWNVLGADVVSAAGTDLYIDDDEHPDLFWALRGGSAGFPGVVTRFHLRLQPLPEIRGRRVAFPAARLDELLPWVAERLRSLPPGIEISVIVRRPQGEGPAAPRATVVATGFGAGGAEAEAKIETALATLPAGEAIEDSGVETLRLNDLEGEGGWEEGLRYFADTCWVSDGYAEIGRRLAAAIEAAPSPLSRIVLAFGFMPEPAPEVAFTRFGDLTVNVYATWANGAEDEPNIDWVRATMAPLDRVKDGHYIGETDLSISPDRVEEAYPDDKWRRLAGVIAEYDPDGRFHTFVGAED